jgi:hypothetical protein
VESRPVVRSALQLESLISEKDALPIAITEAGRLPFRLRNDSSVPIETVELSTQDPATLNGQTRLTIGTLAPYEERLIIVDPRRTNMLRMTASAHAIPLTQVTTPLAASADPVAAIELDVSTPGQDAFVYTKAERPFSLLVYHPALREAIDHVRVFDIEADEQRLRIPLDPTYVKSVDRWIAVPFRRTNKGVVVGSLAEGIGTTPFTLSVSARYYAATGDQIGVGPLPPKVGEPTKYWISWNIGPTTADLANVSIMAFLGKGVALTGRHALPFGGTIVEKDGAAVWSVEHLAASAEPITASAEVVFTPTVTMRGKPATLIESSQAIAKETRSATTLESVAEAIDTTLPSDARAGGKGVVE